MNTNSLANFKKNIALAIASGNDDMLEDFILDFRDASYEWGVNDMLRKFSSGIECCDEEGNTIGTVKYHFEKGDMSVGIGDYESFILTKTSVVCEDCGNDADIRDNIGSWCKKCFYEG